MRIHRRVAFAESMTNDRAVIERILPPGVRSAEARADPPDVLLFPAEAKVVARAVQRRRLEFATVRHLARIGLGELGVPAGPILPGHRGAPTWPPGIVGSMTHCHGYRAAAVAPAADVGGLGIDAEIHEPLPDGVGRLVASEDEQAHLEEVAHHRSHIHWDRLLFAAKECVYKVWSPRTGSGSTSSTRRSPSTRMPDRSPPGCLCPDRSWICAAGSSSRTDSP